MGVVQGAHEVDYTKSWLKTQFFSLQVCLWRCAGQVRDGKIQNNCGRRPQVAGYLQGRRTSIRRDLRRPDGHPSTRQRHLNLELCQDCCPHLSSPSADWGEILDTYQRDQQPKFHRTVCQNGGRSWSSRGDRHHRGSCAFFHGEMGVLPADEKGGWSEGDGRD